MLLNMVEHGATPSWKNIVYKMMIIPFISIATAYQAIKDVFVQLKGRDLQNRIG